MKVHFMLSWNTICWCLLVLCFYEYEIVKWNDLKMFYLHKPQQFVFLVFFSDIDDSAIIHFFFVLVESAPLQEMKLVTSSNSRYYFSWAWPKGWLVAFERVRVRVEDKTASTDSIFGSICPNKCHEPSWRKLKNIFGDYVIDNSVVERISLTSNNFKEIHPMKERKNVKQNDFWFTKSINCLTGVSAKLFHENVSTWRTFPPVNHEYRFVLVKNVYFINQSICKLQLWVWGVRVRSTPTSRPLQPDPRSGR